MGLLGAAGKPASYRFTHIVLECLRIQSLVYPGSTVLLPAFALVARGCTFSAFDLWAEGTGERAAGRASSEVMGKCDELVQGRRQEKQCNLIGASNYLPCFRNLSSLLKAKRRRRRVKRGLPLSHSQLTPSGKGVPISRVPVRSPVLECHNHEPAP